MSVSILCPQCKRTYKPSKRWCQHCQIELSGPFQKYRVRVKDPHSKKWLSKVVDNLAEARTVEARLKTTPDYLSLPLIDEGFNNFIKWAETNKASWKDDLNRWTRHIKPHLGGKRMDAIKPKDVQGALDAMQEYAPATVKQTFQLINRVYNWNTKRLYFHGDNPCKAVEPPKFDNKIIRSLSRDELTRLFAVLDNWENERPVLVIRFLLFSGKRRSEVLKLKWSDVDLDNGFITLRGTKNRETQYIPLNETCREIIQRAAELKISEYVFPSTAGSYYWTFTDSWKFIRKKADLKNFRCHDLRHTYASWLASSGKVDLYTLQNLLGHKTISMTQRYAHLFPGALRRGAKVADTVFDTKK